MWSTVKSADARRWTPFVGTRDAGPRPVAAVWREVDAETGAPVFVCPDCWREIEAAGGRVTLVRIDPKLKGQVAKHSERVAATLGLPVGDGKVLVADVQIEYIDATGRNGRCNVEVASEHTAAKRSGRRPWPASRSTPGRPDGATRNGRQK